MSLIYLVEGAVIGFSLAAQIGPVGILCIRRTLEHGARYGLVIGVSAACCDMVYGIVAASGSRSSAAFRPHSLADKAIKVPGGHTWTFISTALLVFTNPLTLFAFAAAFAVIGVKNIVGHPFSGLMLIVGVFFGSLTWFVLLAGLVHSFKEKVMRIGLTLVNRVAGSLLMLCGLFALWNGISGL